MQTISFVIPVYRDAPTLAPTHEQITALFNDELKGLDYEFVFIDDGSDDDSLDEMLKIQEKDDNVKVIKLSRNFGQRSAVLCGLEHCTGDAVVKMSADMQEPIDVIPQMVKEWQKDNEIVICYRHERDDALIDRFFSNMFYNFLRLTDKRIPKGGFDFYLLGRRALDNLTKMKYQNRFLQGDLLWLGFSMKYLPYHRKLRAEGKSQNTISKRVKFFIDGVLNSSYLPIRFISFMGITISLIGFFFALAIIINKLTNSEPYTGWASIMVLNLVIGGLIMFMLGIIGEYIWRIHDEVKERPNYVIDKIFRRPESAEQKNKDDS